MTLGIFLFCTSLEENLSLLIGKFALRVLQLSKKGFFLALVRPFDAVSRRKRKEGRRKEASNFERIRGQPSSMSKSLQNLRENAGKREVEEEEALFAPWHFERKRCHLPNENSRDNSQDKELQNPTDFCLHAVYL